MAAAPHVVPLVTQSRDWQHGVFLGATCSSETTAAATGAVGVVRRDPMAMLPFIGYHAGDYFQHWLDIGKARRRREAAADLLRQLVPEGRRGQLPLARLRREQPRPEMDRRAGRAARAPADETAIGFVPARGALDAEGLDLTPEQLAKALAVDPEEWRAEIPLIEEWFAKIGDKMPSTLLAELDALKERLAPS